MSGILVGDLLGWVHLPE